MGGNIQYGVPDEVVGVHIAANSEGRQPLASSVAYTGAGGGAVACAGRVVTAVDPW